jgi:hypothetical protein
MIDIVLTGLKDDEDGARLLWVCGAHEVPWGQEETLRAQSALTASRGRRDDEPEPGQPCR